MTDIKDMMYGKNLAEDGPRPTPYIPSEESSSDNSSAWLWKTDWCRKNDLNPRDKESWDKSQAAYEKELKVIDALSTSHIPITKPRPTFQYNEEPIKIEEQEDVMSFNIGESNYATKKIQPWHIWEEYNLNPWDADIVKRVLRTKKQVGKTKLASRIEDYKKIIHNCQYRIKKLEESNTLAKRRK